MSEILTLARKLRRALHNNTGMKLSASQVAECITIGWLDSVTQAENEELKCHARRHPIVSETTGLTSGEMAEVRKSGKFENTTLKLDRQSISVLSNGI